jgi:hypothetical protein
MAWTWVGAVTAGIGVSAWFVAERTTAVSGAPGPAISALAHSINNAETAQRIIEAVDWPMAIAAGCVLLLVAGSLVRLGPREWFTAMLNGEHTSDAAATER